MISFFRMPVAGLVFFLLFLPCIALGQPVGPSVDVPEWAKDVIWYQIFPERFRNGDPTNDPKVTDIVNSWPHLQPAGWKVSPWTGDWYARPDWEKKASDEFYVTVQTRRYGGDVAGIISKLDYLKTLGVTAIYINPMFEAPSLHKYDGSYFHHIDDNFGPDPEGDRRLMVQETPTDPSTWQWTSADRLFVTLIQEAHRRDIRIVLDGVFNHVGLESFVFRDVARNQQKSPYADWLTVTSWDNPATKDTSEFAYAGWMGVRELPELKEDENGLVKPVRDYVFASVRRWMDPNGDGDPSDGLDGWRLDVAEMVNLRFWEVFRDTVRSINPEAYIAGEVWWQDWPRFKMFNGRPWLEGTAFDAVMNYRLASAVRKYFLGADLAPDSVYAAGDFADELQSLLNDYPSEVNYVLLNTLDSHDTDRLASQIVNPNTFFDHRIGVRDNPQYDVRKPNETERALQRRMLAFQFTFVGAPHIYYGDEAGMWGADDPDERKPMLWDDLTYEDETAHPLGLERPSDPVVFDKELFAYYQKLARLRTASVALRRGLFRVLSAGEDEGLFVYERRYGDDVVVVAINPSDQAHTVTLPAGAWNTNGPAVFIDELTGTRVQAAETLSFTAPAESAMIWRKQ